MRVLIVTCVFPPEPMVSSRTSYQIGEDLVRQGHQVIVITAYPSRPAGEGYSGFRRRLFSLERNEYGVKVVRCFSFFSSESSMMSRFVENFSFGVTSSMAALFVRRPDVIYSITWPIFASGLLNLVARLRGIPMVMSVQDVYPESLSSQERISQESRVFRLLRKLDSFISQRCKSLIVISEHFRQIYIDTRSIPAERIHLIHNWIDTSSIQLKANGIDFRSRFGISPDAFVLLYGGNIGVAAGVENVISSFQYLQDLSTLHLIVAGAGPNLAVCRALTERIAPDRIHFHTPWLQEETSAAMLSADVLVLPTRGNQSMASVPSKLMTYMLASRPVIATALPESQTAKVVIKAKCGWVTQPDNEHSLALLIREAIALSPEDRLLMGSSGREYVMRHFGREENVSKVIQVLRHAAAN